MSHCSIVPPHMLRELSRSDLTGPARCAERTLLLDDEARHARIGRVGRQPFALTGGAGDGPQRTVHDAQGAEVVPGTLVRSEGGDATGDAAADEAYDGLGHTWRLWSEEYGRDSLDGAGLPLVATVHYGREYVNAFWNGSQMVFGDGDGEIFTRFTASLDVIGHELAHGVTEHTSGLTYQGQSGALNEHVSDVFGTLVKQHHLQQDAQTADWLIGAELLMPSVQGEALRSMKAPGTAYDDPRLGTDPQPAHMRDYVETSDDNGGVHINSGIPNKAFHLVATTLGGPAWEAPGLVWFDVITGEISADCDFATFAGLTVAAARARYGQGSTEAEAVSAAWSDVGVTAAVGGGPDDGAPTSALRLSRSGGVAGMMRSREVRLEELPEGDAHGIRRLLAAPELPEMIEQPARPDAFSYGLREDGDGVDVQIPESALSSETRELLERVLRGQD